MKGQPTQVYWLQLEIKAAPTVEKPEYPLTPSPVADTKTPGAKDEEKLPATGEHSSK